VAAFNAILDEKLARSGATVVKLNFLSLQQVE
jgi:hypothetical protein